MGKKRVILTSAMIAAIALSTAACGSSSASSSSGSGTTLTYWATQTGTSLDATKQALTPVLDEFTKQTGVQVKLEVIGWNDLQTRIQTAVASGQGPDVLGIGNTWASSLQATGAFLPFDSANMTAIGGADKFIKTALDTGGAPGKDVTSVPLYGQVYGLYYNVQMFKDAGLQPPTTWPELVSDAQKLTNPATGVHGMVLDAGSYTGNSHYAFINAAQNGADLFDAQGNPTFATTGVVDGIKRYLDLMQTDKVVNPADAQNDSSTKSMDAFANKKAAMIVNQNNGDSGIAARGMKPSEYGVVPLPAPVGGKKIASFPAGTNVSIFKNTKNKDAALKFVNYMTSAPAQSTMDKAFHELPVLKGVAPNFTDNAAESQVFQDIYNNMSKPEPLVPAEDQFESTVGKAMNDMFAKIASGGTVSTSDIMAAMKTAQNQVKTSIGG
jgi:multiple sugar transport system substrate-binding protein